MNISMPSEVSSFLRRDGYVGEIPKDVLEVVMEHPEEHVYGWVSDSSTILLCMIN